MDIPSHLMKPELGDFVSLKPLNIAGKVVDPMTRLPQLWGWSEEQRFGMLRMGEVAFRFFLKDEAEQAARREELVADVTQLTRTVAELRLEAEQLDQANEPRRDALEALRAALDEVDVFLPAKG